MELLHDCVEVTDCLSRTSASELILPSEAAATAQIVCCSKLCTSLPAAEVAAVSSTEHWGQLRRFWLCGPQQRSCARPSKKYPRLIGRPHELYHSKDMPSCIVSSSCHSFGRFVYLFPLSGGGNCSNGIANSFGLRPLTLRQAVELLEKGMSG